MSKPAFRAQTVDIACLPLRQDLLSKNVLMTAQRDFRLGNSPSIFDISKTLVLKQLSPSIHKFYHELIYSGLSAE
jgi:hypothetical protein